MDDKEFFGTVEFTVSAGLTPWLDPSEYVHSVTGRAMVASNVEGEEREEEVGEITLSYGTPRPAETTVAATDEASYTCHSCGEDIVISPDLSAGSHQEYVEDCPVCCRPNVVHIEIDEDGEVRVWSEPEQD